MESKIKIREATPQEDTIIAKHFSQLWRDNHIAEEYVKPDWLTMTQQFIKNARKELKFKAFIAEIDNGIVGSTSCQLFAGLYPLVLTRDYREYGYIWNVYVEPEYRYQGIGTRLTQQACEYLKSMGCTQAILHASPYGKSVYSQLGFVESNEMRLDLT